MRYRFGVILLLSGWSIQANAAQEGLDICAQKIDEQVRLNCYDGWQERQKAPAVTRRVRRTNETRWITAQREEVESSREGDRFVILPYRTNYFLALDYDSNPNAKTSTATSTTTPNQAGNDTAIANEDFDNIEAKIQISFKTRLLDGPFRENSSLWIGYTQLLMWQMYNRAESSPFREINYEPEIFVQFIDPMKFLGLRSTVANIGINHQSNGRSQSTSQGWNRIVASLFWGNEDYVVGVQPWVRIPESSSDDDNPDIEKYAGYGQLFGSRKYGRNTLAVTLHNNLRQHSNLGAIQLDWSFPLGFTPRLKGYVQYFNGYGETLIDYNDSVNRIGIGVLLTDWL